MTEASPIDDHSIELQHLRKNILDDSDHLSSTSISDPLNQNLSSFRDNCDDRIDSLRLVRSRSNSSNFSNTGYLFLAVVFCMMCCSSLLVTPSNIIKITSQSQGFAKIISGGANNFGVTNNRKLMSANPSSGDANKASKNAQASLASPLNEDIEMMSDTASSNSRDLVKEEPEIGAI